MTKTAFMKIHLHLWLIGLCFAPAAAHAADPVKSKQATKKAAPAKLVFPPVHYAVPGAEMEIIHKHPTEA